ncbi:MAG: nucleotidyltransferase substrate binding protein [Oligoflexia bacterium]|nr:nucleotidyltransferase substrate binding protein [Oligoflexia bacterium]
MANKGLENFKATVETLASYLAQPIITDRDKAGVIQAFEFTFEQCWKALQQKAQKEGVTVGSPKTAFSFAMQSGLIKPQDEKLWLEMLEDRNLTTHTYKKELANQVVVRIKENYLPAFEHLLQKLK